MLPIFGLIPFDALRAELGPDPIACEDGTLVVASAWLDNRDDLVRELGDGSDEELVARAFGRWRTEAPQHLLGDWAFAAWDPRERRLFLARDHYGYTSLYYHRDAQRFAFSSTRRWLFEHCAPRELNELHLEQYLANSVPGDTTMHKGIYRVPPAHQVTVTDDAIRVERYWKMEDAPAIRLRSDDAYAEQFLELYRQAIRARLRGPQRIASTLSSGLDSGSVTAIAARELPTLIALTAVPLFAEATNIVERADEWPLAHAIAMRCGNVEHIAVAAERMTAIAALDRSLELHEEPVFMARHLPWALGLFEACRDLGCGALLIAQMGNGGGSWDGPIERRMELLLPKLHPFGTFWGEMAAGYGVDVRDPTADIRLLRFCLGIPKEQFTGRRLMRRAVEGLLPPEVQRNTMHGRQGADLPLRLRADAANVDEALAEIERTPAAVAHLDLPQMRRDWQSLQGRLGDHSFRDAAQFYRALLVGRFLARSLR